MLTYVHEKLRTPSLAPPIFTHKHGIDYICVMINFPPPMRRGVQVALIIGIVTIAYDFLSASNPKVIPMLGTADAIADDDPLLILLDTRAPPPFTESPSRPDSSTNTATSTSTSTGSSTSTGTATASPTPSPSLTESPSVASGFTSVSGVSSRLSFPSSETLPLISAAAEYDYDPSIWSPADPKSCDGIYGNGYNMPFQLHTAVPCRMHGALRFHVCVAGT